MSAIYEANANSWLLAVPAYRPGPTAEEAAARFGWTPGQILKLSSNESPLGPSPSVVTQIRERASYVHLYPDSEARALRAAIGAYLNLSAEEVVVSAGSSALMMSIVAAYTREGDSIGAMDPGFSLYQEVAAVFHRRHRHIPLTPQFDLESDAVRRVLRDGLRLLILTRPNNPTSKLVPLSQVREIVAMAREVAAMVVCDEAYVEFADGDVSAAALVRESDNLLVTRTFSKAFGLADLRLGYAVGPVTAIGYLRRTCAKWPTGALAQAAGIAALSDQAHLRDVQRIVQRGRETLAAGLKDLGFDVVEPAQGNFLMVDVTSHGFAAPKVAEYLCRAHGILVRGDFDPVYVRISVGVREANARLLAGIAQMVAEAGGDM